MNECEFKKHKSYNKSMNERKIEIRKERANQGIKRNK